MAATTTPRSRRRRNKNEKDSNVTRSTQHHPTEKSFKYLYIGIIVALIACGLVWYKFKRLGGDGRRAKLYLPPSWEKIVQTSLPTTEWTNSSVLRDKYHNQPVLLRNAPPSTHWKTNQWTSSYLKNQLPSTVNVKTRSTDGRFIHYDPSLKLSSPMPYRTKSMKSSTLQSLLQKTTTEYDFFYLNEEISVLSPGLAKDTSPLLESMYVRDFPVTKWWRHESEVIQPMTKIWIGGKGSKDNDNNDDYMFANCHYDAMHNIFTQIHGRKEFLLLSPEAWKYLKVYSRNHPSHRQSQFNLHRPNSLSASSSNDELQIYKIVLNPGETMYLPPFWFHDVTTIDSSSVSVNVWSNCAALNNMQVALRDPVPYLSDFEKRQWIYDSNTNLYALQVFLKSVIKSVFKTEATEFIDVVVNNNAGEDDLRSTVFNCATPSDNILLKKTMEEEIVPAWLERSFVTMRRREHWILVSSFVEAIAAEFLSPKSVPSFLRDCIKEV